MEGGYRHSHQTRHNESDISTLLQNEKVLEVKFEALVAQNATLRGPSNRSKLQQNKVTISPTEKLSIAGLNGTLQKELANMLATLLRSKQMIAEALGKVRRTRCPLED